MSDSTKKADDGDHEGPDDRKDPDKDKTFGIKIDRAEYQVRKKNLTGAELRRLPNPDVGADRDLFEVVPGGSDLKIEDDAKVKMRDGLRFFTAPAQINPGRN